jgi:hypothetical protein
MKSLLVIFCLLLCVVPCYSESVILLPPKDTTEESVKSAVPAILKRCEAYGYTGMTASFLNNNRWPAIYLTSPSDIGDMMRSNLVKLFAVAGKSVDLCQVYSQTEIEKEQFQPGNAAAPKGTLWAYVLSPLGTRLAQTRDGKTAPPLLVYSDRVLPRSEMNFFVTPRLIEIKTETIKKFKLEGYPILRIDGAILSHSYTVYSDNPSEEKLVFVYKMDGPNVCFKKCERCNGNGFFIQRIPETIVVGPLMPGASRGSPEQSRRVACSVCSGSGRVSGYRNDVIQFIFNDYAAFTWVAIPLPVPFTIIKTPEGFLPPPQPPAAIQVPVNKNTKCSACFGSGICAYCQGTGIYKNASKCSVCSGGGGAESNPGKCSRCKGTGQVK